MVNLGKSLHYSGAFDCSIWHCALIVMLYLLYSDIAVLCCAIL